MTLDIPAFLESIDIASRASGLIPFMEMIGPIEGDDGNPLVDPGEMESVKRKLPVIEQAAALTEGAPVPMVASLTSNSKFKLFVRLNREKLLVDGLQDLDGEARIVASIQSKVEREKPTEISHVVPGQPATNRAQRRRSGGQDSSNITLRYPAAVVTPIAIFR